LRAGNYVEIAIQDEGPGIPGDVLPRIFAPFFTTREHGSGLGLTASFSIVKHHGGSIKVVSATGKGTTFFILLPAAQGGEIAEGKKRPARPPRAAAAFS